MYTYRVKLREKALLWGTNNIQEKPGVSLLLTIHSDPFGDPVDLSWDVAGVAAPVTKALGRLMPGHVITLNLRNASAVIAQPVHNGSNRVSCVLSYDPTRADDL